MGARRAHLARARGRARLDVGDGADERVARALVDVWRRATVACQRPPRQAETAEDVLATQPMPVKDEPAKGSPGQKMVASRPQAGEYDGPAATRAGMYTAARRRRSTESERVDSMVRDEATVLRRLGHDNQLVSPRSNRSS